MQSEEHDVEECLDFLSPQFDPLRALATSPSKIQLPCPDVRPCDNLRMYEQGVCTVSDNPSYKSAIFSNILSSL